MVHILSSLSLSGSRQPLHTASKHVTLSAAKGLSRQTRRSNNDSTGNRTRPAEEGLQRGGYILWENSENGASPQVIDGAPVVGYKDEQGVAATSTTESYVALKLFIENWRWAGVPFYLRTGKHLPKRSTEVTIQFKRVPHQLYKPTETRGLVPNRLTLRIQPDEGISLKFGAKVPGAARQLSSVDMNFSYASGFGVKSPEAYERLLADCMVGDSTLFIRRDEVEASWRMVDSITTAWRDMPTSTVSNYPAGSWGPEEADDLIQNDGRQWANP